MELDFTKVFSSDGGRAPIRMEDWVKGWVAIVGGVNGIPTAQQFNSVSYFIESKVNEAYRAASEALDGLEHSDIDCGHFDEETGAVSLHDASPIAHQLMEVDGNATEASKAAESLEEHMADPLAHRNIVLDGNLN